MTTQRTFRQHDAMGEKMRALAAYRQRLMDLPKETLIGLILWFKVKS